MGRRAEGSGGEGMEGTKPAVLHSVALLQPLLPLLWTPGALAGRGPAAGFRGTGISVGPGCIPGWAAAPGTRPPLAVPSGAAFSCSPLDGVANKMRSIPWPGRTAEAIVMPGRKGEGDWQGRGEPAVAALFKGSALRWALGALFTGCGAPAIRLFPARRCTLGREAFLPFFGGLGGPLFSIYHRMGECKNAVCSLAGRCVACARFSGGRGNQRISA